ncbi:MAG: hypothetical protein ACJAYK_000177 [Crocinitomicaceae bacterium]|jgi:hypothetical protein
MTFKMIQILIYTPALIIIYSQVVYADIYKCTDKQGLAIFTDRPCLLSGTDSSSIADKLYIPKADIISLKELDIKKSKYRTERRTHRENKKSDCVFFSSTELRTLRVKQRYKKGMPAADIKKRFGKPTAIQKTGTDKQKWTYKKSNYILKFNFKDQCLSSWKETWHGKKSKIDKYREN